MAASGCLAGGTRSWALLWAAVQACHMVRLGQAGHALRALQLLPQAPKDNCSAQGKRVLRDWAYVGRKGRSGESWQPHSPPRLLHLHASVPRPRPLKPAPQALGFGQGRPVLCWTPLLLDSLPVGTGKEGAVGREVGPSVQPFTGACVP